MPTTLAIKQSLEESGISLRRLAAYPVLAIERGPLPARPSMKRSDRFESHIDKLG